MLGLLVSSFVGACADGKLVGCCTDGCFDGYLDGVIVGSHAGSSEGD